MTDEWYKKRQLEEMQKQTDAMIDQSMALMDIRDALVGMLAIFMTDIAANPNVSKANFEKSKRAVEMVGEEINKRWPE